MRSWKNATPLGAAANRAIQTLAREFEFRGQYTHLCINAPTDYSSITDDTYKDQFS